MQSDDAMHSTHRPLGPVSIRTELAGALGTYLTLSYVFLLNPILLSRAGIDLGAAFFATVVSAAISTLLMGLWARLPFAIAPAPSITTFFVSYVCLTLGLPWQAAMAAVILSGVLSIIMTAASIREKFVQQVPDGLKISVLFAIAGFMVANGLSQAKLISFSEGLMEFGKLSPSSLLLPSSMVFFAGLGVTVLFHIPWWRFSGAPLLGILAATITAAYFGIHAKTQVELSTAMLSSVGQFDFAALLDPRFATAMLVFFMIDFFGGVGKFIGLLRAMAPEVRKIQEPKLGRALYVDGIGNMVGGVLGASSLAVFISSAVGIRMGARTGLTAVFIAGMMILSLAYIPLVGSIPVEAISGIIVFIGVLLLPFGEVFGARRTISRVEAAVALGAAIIGLITFGIDKAMLFVFVVYSARALKGGLHRHDAILHTMTVLLGLAVAAQTLK